MWLILFWLICSIAVIAERAVYLWGASINKEVFLATMQKCILAGDVAKAVKMCSAANAPLPESSSATQANHIRPPPDIDRLQDNRNEATALSCRAVLRLPIASVVLRSDFNTSSLSGSGSSGRTSLVRGGSGPGGAQAAAADGGAGSTEEFDYDELARRLLLQVVQRLSTLPVEGAEPAEDTGPGEGVDSDVSLARAVAGLEQKLASVRSNQQRLTEENAKLREQLRAAQESLAQAQERAAADPAAVRLDSAEVEFDRVAVRRVGRRRRAERHR